MRRDSDICHERAVEFSEVNEMFDLRVSLATAFAIFHLSSHIFLRATLLAVSSARLYCFYVLTASKANSQSEQ